MRAVPLVAAVLLAGLLRSPVSTPGSQLEVRRDGRWISWWHAAAAPVQWRGGMLEEDVDWTVAAPGVEHGELLLRVMPGRLALRVLLVRAAPKSLQWRIEPPRTRVLRGAAWSIADAPEDALLAFNGGQFTDRQPWGWIVSDGVELRPPGYGPLSAAITFDDAGMRIVPHAALAEYRRRVRPRVAIQSYPVLLWPGGSVPEELRAQGRGVDLDHRDGRFTLCTLRDGRMLLMLTRTTYPGVLAAIPLGLTVPEQAALAGALGCDAAVSLDGGISAQLTIRGTSGPQEWKGLRRVPLGIVASPRPPDRLPGCRPDVFYQKRSRSSRPSQRLNALYGGRSSSSCARSWSQVVLPARSAKSR